MGACSGCVRSSEESARRRTRAEALAQATHLVAVAAKGGNDPLEAILGGIVAAVSVVVPATIAALVLPREDSLENVVVSPAGEHRVGQRIPRHSGVTGRAFRTGALQRVDETSSDPDFVNLLPDSFPTPRSEVAAPVVVRGEIAGVLNLESAEPRAFDADDVAVIQAFADVIAIVFDRERQREELRRSALYDPLTGLPNRTRFVQTLAQAIRDEASRTFAVLYVDLDRFREVVDAFGYRVGDDILREVASRIAAALAPEDVLARVGGDRFAVLARSANDYVGATLAAGRILDMLRDPFSAGTQAAYLEVSIGAALHPDHAQSADLLVRNAEVAMYAAKEAGGAGLFLYAPDADPQSEGRVALMAELRGAIARGELILEYQPQVDTRTGRVIGCEALVRWWHPGRGLLHPAAFVPVAERTGLIKLLTLWVVGEALRQSARWAREGHDLSVAVNLSTRNLRDPLLFDGIERLLRSAAVPADRLVLEVTEGTVMQDPERGIELLRRFRDRGIRIAIDDFGTGQSSLAYLDRLPIHEVKIDRSFVRDVATNENHAAIVRAVADLSHAVGLRVVAEGVEDRAAWERVRVLGCDVVQGFEVGRPLGASEILARL